MTISNDTLQAILNEKPSVRLAESLKALKVFLATPNCEVDMSEYHAVKEDLPSEDICLACLGGASTLVRFDIPDTRWHEFGHSKQVVHYLDLTHLGREYSLVHIIGVYERTLDSAMRGNVTEMLKMMDIKRNCTDAEWRKWNFEAATWAGDPTLWLAQMNDLVNKLKRAGY